MTAASRRLALAFAFALALPLASCTDAPPPTTVKPVIDPSALDGSDPKKLLAAVDQMAGQLKDKPKSFEVLSALGNLYYENGRYLEAADSFRLALAISAPVEAERDALLKKGIKPAAELPLACRRSGPTYGLTQIAAEARRLGQTDPAAALRCDEEALTAAIADRARRGNSLYLVGQPDGALAEHRRVLEEAPDYPESLFFVGAITLEQSHGDKAKLEEGKRYWRRLLEVAPDHPRADIVRQSLPKADELFGKKPPQDGSAQAAGGLPPNHPSIDAAGAGPFQGNAAGSPMAHRGANAEELPGPGMAGQGGPGANGSGPSPETLRNVADAVSQTERTPELEKGLDDLTTQAEALLDTGKYQEARDKIVRVMPLRSQDARTAADMGAAMRGLGRDEMAERVLDRALELDPKQPRALYELGRLSEARGDKATALSRLRALQDADAKFAQAHGVAGEISRLQ